MKPKISLLTAALLALAATLAPLSLSAASKVGDGFLDPTEECDDGNTNDQDGCSSSGKYEGVDVCDADGQNCLNFSVFAPLAGQLSAEKNSQVIAGFYKPSETNPIQDYNEKPQSFTISVRDANDTELCKHEFNETNADDTLVRPVWIFNCETKIPENAYISVTYLTKETKFPWKFSTPTPGGITVASPSKLIEFYKKEDPFLEHQGQKLENSEGKFSVFLTKLNATTPKFKKKTLFGTYIKEDTTTKTWTLLSAPENATAGTSIFDIEDLDMDGDGIYFIQPSLREFKNKKYHFYNNSTRVIYREVTLPHVKMESVAFDKTTNTWSFREIKISKNEEGTLPIHHGKVKFILEKADKIDDNFAPIFDSKIEFSEDTGFSGKLENYSLDPLQEPGIWRLTLQAIDRSGNISSEREEETLIYTVLGAATIDSVTPTGRSVTIKGKKTGLGTDAVLLTVEQISPKTKPIIRDREVLSQDNNKEWSVGPKTLKALSRLGAGTFRVTATIRNSNFPSVSKEFTIEPTTITSIESHASQKSITIKGTANPGESLYVKLGDPKDFDSTETVKVQAGADKTWSATFTDLDFSKEYEIIANEATKTYTAPTPEADDNADSSKNQGEGCSSTNSAPGDGIVAALLAILAMVGIGRRRKEN